MPRRTAAVLLLLVSLPADLLAARDAHADIAVSAPPALAAFAQRVRSVDVAALRTALTSAGLELPPEIRVTLVPNADPDARIVPDWIAGLAFGTRDIVIFPERVLAYPYDSLESVVRHEVAHLALNARAGGAPLPRWFHEGVATSVDARGRSAPYLQLLLTIVRQPDLASLSRLFVSDSEPALQQAYVLSALMMHHLRERYGAAVPGAIARRVASGMTFADAFRAETGVTPDRAADDAWRGYRRWTEWVPALTSPSASWAVIVLLAFAAFVAQRRRRIRRRRAWDEEEEW